MGRKVFASVLGTGAYKSCTYSLDGFECETEYIQKATYEYLREKVGDFKEGDKIYVFVTKKSKRVNWDKNIVYDYKSKTEKVQGKGLRDIFAEIVPEGIVEAVDIEDGMNEAEISHNFDIIYNKFSQGDEVYFDITHGFRYLPMLVVVIGMYSKLLKHIDLKMVTYGNWEARDSETNKAPIINLSWMLNLLEFTIGTSEYLSCGSSDRLLEITSRWNNEKNRAKTEDAEQYKTMRYFVNSLNDFVQNRRLCAGKDIIKAVDVDRLNKNIEVLKDELRLYNPIVNHVKDNILSSSTKDYIENGYRAALWCVEKKLYQQAVTILRENIITEICVILYGRAGIDLRKKERETVERNFNILIKSKYEDKGNVNADTEEIRNMFAKIIENKGEESAEALMKLFVKVADVRNTINHCGFQDKTFLNKKIAGNIKKYVEEAERMYVEKFNS